MELRSYGEIVRRRVRVIAIVGVVTVLVGSVGTFLLPPVYIASTTLRVRTSANLSVDAVSYDSIMYATRLLNTYSKIVTGGPILEQMRSRLGLAELPRVTVDVPANSELMQISVENRSPTVAADAANALAELLIGNVRQLDISAASTTRQALDRQLARLRDELDQSRAAPTDSSPPGSAQPAPADLLQQQYARVADQDARARLAEVVPQNSLYVLEPATAPVAPARPQRAVNMAVSLLLGIAGGIGVAFVLENLDKRLYTTRGIEDVADVAVLTAVPASHTRGLFDANSPEQEALRRVCTQWYRPERGTPGPRRALVTSAIPREGKSTIAANLALVVAATGRRVAVVDCDLRLPVQHKIFALPNDVGVSSYLHGKLGLESIVQTTRVPELDVITSGPLPVNPAEIIGSQRLASFLQELDTWYDLVVIDSPSLLAVADTLAVVPLVDRVMFVVGRGQASTEAVRMARKQLIGAGARSIGVVVTRAEPGDGGYAYYRRATVQ